MIVINRQMANLQAVCGTADEDPFADDHPVGADRDSGLACRLEAADPDSEMAGDRLADGLPVGADPGFDRADGRLVDDRLAGAGHGSGTADDQLAGAHPADAGRGFDKDVHLVDDRLADVDHDSGMDARLVGLDRVVVLRVSLYRHHRAHTSYGTLPGWHQARGEGAGRDFDRVGVRLADDLPVGADLGFDKADDHPADAVLDFEKVDGHLVGDLQQDVVRAALRHGCRSCHRVGQRCKGVFHQRPDERCHAAYGCRDALHRLPSGH